jgi:hypothetical protein
MAKQQKDKVIGRADLIEFLDNSSDFAFEIRTLQLLHEAGFHVDHGGSYDDPATHKPREFDFRCSKVDANIFLCLAVECKNLRANFPLLISCLPRRAEESFHEVVYSHNYDVYNPAFRGLKAIRPKARAMRVTGQKSLYQAGESVGKSCAQIGRSSLNGIVSNDTEVYDKWAQALSSTDDLVHFACTVGQ